MSSALGIQQLCGQDNSLLDLTSLSVPIHIEVVKPFLALRSLAIEVGFDLTIASGFRDFNRQLTIWNEKATGIRPVFDCSGCVIDMGSLAP